MTIQVTEKLDQFCEFQAGSSFDLPNLATLQVFHQLHLDILVLTITSTLQRAGQSQSPVGWEGGEEHKYSAVMYETEDGKTTSKSSRLIKVD